MSAAPDPQPQPQIKLSSPKLDELDHRLWAAFAKSDRQAREAEPAITKLKKTVMEQSSPNPTTGKFQRPTLYLDQAKFEAAVSESDKLKLPPPDEAEDEEKPVKGSPR